MKCALLATLVLLCVGAMLPPAPRKRHKPITETSAGAGAAKLIARPKAVLASPNRLLSWEWSPNFGNDYSNVVFVIRSSPDLKQWTPVAMVSTNRWAFQPNQPHAFFAVSASNTFTHLVSE